MLRKALFLILTGMIFTLLLANGGCKRASIPPSPTMPVIFTQIAEGDTPVVLPTKTSLIQATAGAYPQPSTSTSIPATKVPYPEPSVEAHPTQEIPSPTASLAPTMTSTQAAAQQIQASPTKSPVPPTATTTLTTAPIPTATLSPVPTETQPGEYPGPEVSPYPTYSGDDIYPGPEVTYPTTSSTEAYPGPENTPTPQRQHGATATGPALSTPTQFGAATATDRSSSPGIATPTPFQRLGTAGPTPTELPPQLPLAPPPAGSSVTIWHSWSNAEVDILREVIRSFQRSYPDVTFTLLYVPLDDLESTYQEAAYFGQGPSLLLGPASWGPALYLQALITDLEPYIPKNYLADINSAVFSVSWYEEALIGLPISLHGTLLFRNSAIISTPATSFDELIATSREVTHGGVVGTYLDRESRLSAANIISLGGKLMTQAGDPAFNNSYGVEWIDLLKAYDDAGAVTFRTNRDVQMFKRGKVGVIIDDSGDINTLAQAIGTDKLAIDPWPEFNNGHLAGWVEADSAFLNANTTENDRFATLSFMGYLLDPNVQLRLAEVGHIPSVTTTQPRDKLIQQAMVAFQNGVPYPINIDNNVLNVYWDELDKALQSVFFQGKDAVAELKKANDTIFQTIKAMRPTP